LKKKWIMGIGATILGGSILANVAFAAGVLQVEANIVDFSWKIGGHKYSSDTSYSDGSVQLPTSLNYQGTTYIPIRLLAETLGYQVEWDNATRTATLEDPDNSEDPVADLPEENKGKPVTIENNPAHVTSSVNLLSSNDADSKVVATLTAGTQVNISKELGREWLQVAADGQTGYIPASVTDYRFEADRPAWEQKADSIITTGLQFLGTPYLFGAKAGQTATFDCSSFTEYAFGQHKVKLPRVSRQQSTVGKDVPLDQLRKGDLLFFTTPARKKKTGLDHIGHVAIYLGSNQVLHTYRVGIGVTVTTLDAGWKSRLVSAKRVLN
jgi:cell wall-associated NlpC family hydrolase